MTISIDISMPGSDIGVTVGTEVFVAAGVEVAVGTGVPVTVAVNAGTGVRVGVLVGIVVCVAVGSEQISIRPNADVCAEPPLEVHDSEETVKFTLWELPAERLALERSSSKITVI